MYNGETQELVHVLWGHTGSHSCFMGTDRKSFVFYGDRQEVVNVLWGQTGSQSLLSLLIHSQNPARCRGVISVLGYTAILNAERK